MSAKIEPDSGVSRGNSTVKLGLSFEKTAPSALIFATFSCLAASLSPVQAAPDISPTEAASIASSNQTAYQLVGPSSRCFPGLVGLKQIPPSEVANITNENPDSAVTTANVDNTTTSSAQSAAQ